MNPSRPQVTQLGLGPWVTNGTTTCDACLSQQGGSVEYSYSVDREHKACFTATGGVKVAPWGIGGWVQVSGQYCYTYKTTRLVRAKLTCAPGTIEEVEMFRQREDVRVDWTESYYRHIERGKNPQGTSSRCQVLWDAFDDGRDLEVRQWCSDVPNHKFDEWDNWRAVFRTLPCPNSGGSGPCLIPPSAFGLPEHMTWPEFASWAQDTYGVDLSAEIAAAGTTDRPTFAVVDLNDLQDGETVVGTAASGGSVMIEAVPDVLDANTDWFQLYQSLYCQDIVHVGGTIDGATHIGVIEVPAGDNP